MKKIITVGREFGSGGRELGRRLAEKMGFAYYDQEIITEIANRTELSEQYVQNIIEKKPVISFPIHIGRSFYAMAAPAVLQGQKLYQEQCRILRELSEKADCVIVGRCADYILEEKKPFRIFVYAEMESKMARCRQKGQEHERMTDKELYQHILEVDKQRAQYYNFYTDRKWGDRRNYDMCINTTYSDIGEIAAAMAQFFRGGGWKIR